MDFLYDYPYWVGTMEAIENGNITYLKEKDPDGKDYTDSPRTKSGEY